ncbi:NAD(P)/FAD-dependent oxidoreductase [Thioalkalivibrio sp. HK1]|uniref:NAD(P)/FAD-dependent oxidoreductase n=1 Tax=Thioalkalivibrio sp. HK1 TaxID=1469245 RepID=UPI000472AEF4|nr:FAD-binding oxidoreductase [Thioalkalivibrio sp. HK1]
MKRAAEVVIVGAGIAGISSAFELAVRKGLRDIVLVEAGDPLSLTSDKSTECYRNWWPGPDDAMLRLMNRSIDLLETVERESGGRTRLNRRGYLYATADPDRIDTLLANGRRAKAQGAGPLRVHEKGSSGSDWIPSPAQGFAGVPEGADLVLDPDLIRTRFPWLTPDIVACLHARRCGWLSAQQLGMYLLEEARRHGVEVIRGMVRQVDLSGGRVRSVRIASAGGEDIRIDSERLILSTGPHLAASARDLLGIELPVVCERHLKVAFRDHRSAIPGDAPLMVWTDPVTLPWTKEERAELEASPENGWLLDPFPAGVHGRPEGRPGEHWLLILWTFDAQPVPPIFPLPVCDSLPEIALRGWSKMIPALCEYFERLPKTIVDGGYYVRTPENRPLIGPLPVAGAWVNAAWSGFGIMGGCAGGELAANWITGDPMPPWAKAFHPARFDDPAYRQRFAHGDDDGQL